MSETVQNVSQNRWKKIIFNRFYLELLAYFLILIFGVIINAIVYTVNSTHQAQMIVSIVTTILVCLMMFLLGYVSARNKVGIKKYLPVFVLTLIFGVLTIIRILLVIIGYESGIATIFIYANNVFMESAQTIFYCLEGLFKDYLSYVAIMITFIFMFIGTRANVKASKKEKGEENA